MSDHARLLDQFLAARRALLAAPERKEELRRTAQQRQEAKDRLVDLPLDPDLATNLSIFKALLDGSSDTIFREFQLGGSIPAVLISITGLVEPEHLEIAVLKHLLKAKALDLACPPRALPEVIKGKALPLQEVKAVRTYREGSTALLSGRALLLAEGMDRALSMGVPWLKHRAVEEPSAEGVIRGPREGFTEALHINLGLLRRRIRSTNLKCAQLTLGRQTQTPVAICYLEGVAHPELVVEVRRRVARIDVDGILDSGYIEELIEENPWSPFPQVQNTERPDTVAGNLLEGRVAIMQDGSPFALIVPTTFTSLMQASEDYYERYLIGTALRALRFTFLMVALTAPSLWIAITTFHPEMLPTSLLLSIAASREGVPFPAFVEALLMEVFFEALREAGVRLPRPVGQAISIVGALVIGEASVQAGLVSAPVVIVVATTGIASFTIPRFNVGISIRMLRFPLIVLAGSLGLFGLMIGLAVILIHLVGLRSFGVPYLQPVAPIAVGDWRDWLLRAPHWLLDHPPGTNDSPDNRRAAPYLMPSPRGPGGIWRRGNKGEKQ